MSRRRSDRRDRAAQRPSSVPTERPDPTVDAPRAARKSDRRPADPPLEERLRSLTVRAAAVLPLRVFLGITFLYAGFDKLLDPTFFDVSNAASIHGQMAAFVRESPIGALVSVAVPAAVPIGLLIAIAEIGIGLGALTGLAFRVAAVGGAVLSLLFWLTASWGATPYYYGADLPYAAGWMTLAIAGTGGLLVPRSLRPPAPGVARGARGRSVEVDTAPLGRRVVLQTGLLAVVAVAAASAAVPLHAMGIRPTSRATGTTGSTGSTGSTGTGAASGSPPPAQGIPVATVTKVDQAGSAAFTVPFSAPSPLPAGDPGVIVRLPDGTYVAFDAVCTHEGCTVDYDTRNAILVCPCHDAIFDPADHAAVLGGPTRTPLAELPIAVDQATGKIILRT